MAESVGDGERDMRVVSLIRLSGESEVDLGGGGVTQVVKFVNCSGIGGVRTTVDADIHERTHWRRHEKC